FVYLSPNQPLIYALPPADGLHEIKLGVEQEALSTVTADRESLPANFVEGMTRSAQQLAGTILPTVDTNGPKTSLCFYTVTEDSKHIVKNHDPDGKVVLVSACSGHGFKY